MQTQIYKRKNERTLKIFLIEKRNLFKIESEMEYFYYYCSFCFAFNSILLLLISLYFSIRIHNHTCPYIISTNEISLAFRFIIFSQDRRLRDLRSPSFFGGG